MVEAWPIHPQSLRLQRSVQPAQTQAEPQVLRVRAGPQQPQDVLQLVRAEQQSLELIAQRQHEPGGHDAGKALVHLPQRLLQA